MKYISLKQARTQNFTVAVSFGVERDAAFEHAQSKNVISMPQPNGTIYTFSKDVNIIWRHGILQVTYKIFIDLYKRGIALKDDRELSMLE